MTVTVFGYTILISKDFDDFSLVLDIKHETPCLTTFPSISKFVKNTPLYVLCVVFSTRFSVFGNVVKDGLLCLM